MKRSFTSSLLLFFILTMIPTSMWSRPFDQLTKLDHQEAKAHKGDADEERRKANMVQFSAGSTLPDCTHACGSCMPCRLVIVGSSACASLTEAESCPISYRCMCNNKTYPVP